MVYVGNVVAESVTNMNPESNPTWPLVDVDVSDRQGLSKVDCVAVWFFCRNRKVTVSPICAVMFEGSKISFPGPPTVMTWSFETAVLVGAAAAVVVGAVAVVATALVEVVAAIPLAAFWKAPN